jgi:hypothetical protein
MFPVPTMVVKTTQSQRQGNKPKQQWLMMADNNNQPKEQPSVGPGGGAGTDDSQLSSLTPKKQLEKIQQWLKTQSSDDVRKLLLAQKFRVASISESDISMAGWSAAHLLDTPFFTVEGLKPVTRPDANTHSKPRMSGDVTKTAREVLKKYYGFNVGFVHWEKFSEEARDEKNRR